MLAADTHLCIDFGTATTTALLSTPDGRWLPVVIDGTTTGPSGVWLDAQTGTLLTGAAAVNAARVRPETWIAEPLRHVGGEPIHIADTTLDPIEVVAAVLRSVAAHAAGLAGAPVGGLTLVVPCRWGPHRRQQMRLAASRTGLPEPRLIADTVAVATHWAAWSATPVTAGTCVLVVNAGAGGVTLAVIQHNDDGAQLLAHHLIPDSDAAHLDTALAVQIVSHAPGAGPELWEKLSAPESAVARHQLLDAVRAAKEALGRQLPRAAIMLPDPYPPAILDQTGLHTATTVLRQRIPDATTQVLAAADTRREDLTVVLLTGGHAVLPGFADTVREATGLPLLPISRPDAAADGAMRIAGPRIARTSAEGVPDVPAPRIKYRWRSLLAPLALALAALALLLQALETGWTREVNSDPLVAFVDLPQLGISGLVIALACWSHATSLAFLLHDAGTTPAELAASARVARRALLTAAAVALALAAAFGVTTSAHFNLYQDTFTRWPIGFAIPVVALTATAGILVTRISPESVPAWVRDCRTPVAATLVAATGILINNAGTSGTVPDLLSFGFSLATIERIGIGLLGVGITLAITRHRTARIIAAIGLGTAFGVLYTFRTKDYYLWAFTTVFMWWVLTAFFRTVRAASPTIDGGIRHVLK
ncbi:Hsp70 family protein [Catenuloplanes japonicus]|uniref:Hsp70 family protein n=1 Tax=Catenuloplanes japonicus TaxID=33876 RepID=UPI0005268F4F|nr:Hsp70 family protein [Catenuloplanes japonicus]